MSHDALNPGAQLSDAGLYLSSQRMVMIAAANRDFAPIHFDTEFAQSTGADDAYGNMMFVQAMMERAISRWAGPGSRIRALRQLRMVAFNRRGDTVSCHATVQSMLEPGIAELAVWLQTSPDRRTATAVAEVVLAAEASEG